MTFDSKIFTTLGMLILFSGACLIAAGLPSKAGFMPLLIGVPGALLCLAQLFIDLRSKPVSEEVEGEAAEEVPETVNEAARSEREMFLWLVVFTACLLCLGFVVGGPLAVVLFVYFEKHNTIKNALFAGLGTLAVLFGIFVWLLELTLFPGFFLEGLF